MAVTAGQMIDETLGLLQSWSLDEQQSATLAAPMLAGDLTGTNTGSRGVATGMSQGMIEIDRELMFCDTITGNAFTIPAWGRGFKSTTAVAHAAGARIISQPTFPRQKLLDYMNETINRVFPEIYTVGSVETTTTFPKITYTLPANAQWVLNIKWQVPDGRLYWQDVRRWRVSPGGGTQFGDTGVTVDIADRMMPGRPLQILYAGYPQPLVAESDIFTTVSGLSAGLIDVIELGAASSATTALELSRLQTSSIEQQNRSQLVAPSAALTSSRFLDQKYQARVAEERATLQRLYPPRITREWI